jgi:diguanylate cyclase (GGDEF)-like protein
MTSVDDVTSPLQELLLQDGALQGVDPVDIAELRQRSQRRALSPGEALLRRGESNAHMYVLLEGVLRVDLEQPEGEPMGRVHPGATVGELSLLAHSTATASVTAETAAALFAVDEDTFYWLVGRSHAFALNLLVTLAQRLQSSNSAAAGQLTLRRHFERVALHDALTGLHNRRWLDDTLPRLAQRHRFAKQPLCVAVMDLDHFKRINDRFGHAAGDYVLVATAEAARTKLRPTDLIARVGGEEFVLIFPQTALAGAGRAAERLREAVAERALQHQGVSMPRATASFGVTELAEGDDVNALLERADRALYRAKSNGRNQVQLEPATGS